MNKFTTRLIIAITVFFIAGCATVEDVQRATDLIQSDNELTRLLVEVRPSDRSGAATYLNGLAAHAKGEADSLKGDQGRWPDAIAYYRIAATAYWRSGRSEVVNNLFEVSNSGTDLCSRLGDKAPDRDCLFLRLVIPFAGLESTASVNGLAGLLKNVHFDDGNATKEEINDMGTIRTGLNQAKPLVEEILGIGVDDRLLSHPGMRQYYCNNAKMAVKHYKLIAGIFATKVREFDDNITDNTLSLGITINEARKLRNLAKEVPSFCQ
jgi:hypothetical protein